MFWSLGGHKPVGHFVDRPLTALALRRPIRLISEWGPALIAAIAELFFVEEHHRRDDCNCEGPAKKQFASNIRQPPNNNQKNGCGIQDDSEGDGVEGR